MFNAGGGEVNHPVQGKPLPPKFLGGDTPDLAGKDRREVLAIVALAARTSTVVLWKDATL